MSRFLHVIYCDDIRHEIGNKRSFMGVYLGELFLHPLPGVLPKFCISANLSTPLDLPFREATLVVKLGDTTLVEQKMDSAALSPDQKNLSPDIIGPRISIDMDLVFAPFEIKGPSKLTCKVITEDGELIGRALRIKPAPDPAVNKQPKAMARRPPLRAAKIAATRRSR